MEDNELFGERHEQEKTGLYGRKHAELCDLHNFSGSLPIWTTDCPTCKKGTLLLYKQGGSAKCDNCNKHFYTDYEVHDELTTREVEYWLMD